MADQVQRSQSAGFLRSIWDGVVLGDYSVNDSATRTASQIGIGLVPGVGQIADARDTAAALEEVGRGKPGGWSNLGFSLIGWIPAAGDFIKSAHRIGLGKTVKGITRALDSVRNTWSGINQYTERQLGKFTGLFYEPATNMKARDLSFGTDGSTNKWGDVKIDYALDPVRSQATLDHESVHSALSPRFKYGQEFRANIGILGYAESHLLRRVEEGLAEAWARWKAEGLSGLRKGWRFPLENDYQIDPARVRIERNILLGIGSSAVGAGADLKQAVNDKR